MSTGEDQKKYWRKAIATDPSFPNAYHALGTLEHTQGRIASAMKTLKQGLSYCPVNHRLHHALGDLYRDAKMLDRAEQSYRKALKYGPAISHGFAYTALAYVAYERNDVEECRRWLHKAVKLNDGRHANAWVALAQFEESQGLIDAARSACMAGIAQYERTLLERSRKIKFRRKDIERAFLEDPVALKNKFLKSVPIYRSGDRFFNVYRNWVRLEERYGTIDSVEEVYQRAVTAFPGNWKLGVGWAQYYVHLGNDSRARELFEEACQRTGSRHADPYRLFAEFETSHENYAAARKILYAGAVAQTYAANGGLGSSAGLSELFHTWALCEWHLGEVGRAEVLLDHALRMTPSGEEGSELRSFLLYSIARLEHWQGENRLAQHCIGLCLKENLMPGGNSKIWDLWADVAIDMNNEQLARQCEEQAEKARSLEDDGDLSRLLAMRKSTSSSTSQSLKGPDMQQLTRRDPWHYKIFGSSSTSHKSSFFHGVKFPEKKLAVRRR
jgi:tetratricopeptide (TPR) repeat protein